MIKQNAGTFATGCTIITFMYVAIEFPAEKCPNICSALLAGNAKGIGSPFDLFNGATNPRS